VIEADVAVVGGGIAGLTAAAFLKRAGARVAVIEAGRAGTGVTSHTTGKVSSLQDAIPIDGVPDAARISPFSRHAFVATGFRKWSLSNGTAAAMILADHILGRPNPWASVFNSNPVKPLTAGVIPGPPTEDLAVHRR
jgi:glycine/D-amino acid oxidase-like deaminating enzyme